MSIVGILVTKNEQDVIERMVRHNFLYLDHLHVIDNGSTDSSPEILGELAREYSIAIETRASAGLEKTDAISALMNDTYRYDTVVPIDTDEFLKGDPGRFRAEIGALGAPVLLPWMTYVPTGIADASEPDVFRRITRRRTREVPQYFKVIVPATMPRPLRLSEGSHALVGVEAAVCPTFRLAHFPVRSAQQLTSKVLIGSWTNRVRRRPKGYGFQWDELARKVTATGCFTPEEIERIANTYASDTEVSLVDDPMPLDSGMLLYTGDIEDPTAQMMRNISQYVDCLIDERVSPKVVAE